MPTTETTLLSDELTTLTGKIFSGDITPLVFELFKDANDIPALIAYLGGGEIDANNHKPDKVVREEGCHRPSVEEWLRKCEQL